MSRRRDRRPPTRVRVPPERALVLHRLLGQSFDGVLIVADDNLLGDRIEVDADIPIAEARAWLADWTEKAGSATTRALIVAGGQIKLADGRIVRLEAGRAASDAS